MAEQPYQDRTLDNVPVVGDDGDDDDDVETCVSHLDKSKDELCREHVNGKPMRNFVFKRICR